MKKTIAVILLLSVLLLCACTNKNADITQSGESLDYTKTQKTSAPKASDVADGDTIAGTPRPTFVLYENKTIKLKLNKTGKLNGYEVTLGETQTEAGDDIVTATCDGKTYKVADGYYVSAYLHGRDTGKQALILGTMSEEIYEVHVLRINREKQHLFYETAKTIGKTVSITDEVIRISRNVDMLGTWYGERNFLLDEKFKLQDTEDTTWVVNADESRNLTAMCDIRARAFSDGSNVAILEGSVVTVVMVAGDFDFVVVKDVASSYLYKIYVESDGHGGYLLEDVGSEEGCFDNIQYWG